MLPDTVEAGDVITITVRTPRGAVAYSPLLILEPKREDHADMTHSLIDRFGVRLLLLALCAAAFVPVIACGEDAAAPVATAAEPQRPATAMPAAPGDTAAPGATAAPAATARPAVIVTTSPPDAPDGGGGPVTVVRANVGVPVGLPAQCPPGCGVEKFTMGAYEMLLQATGLDYTLSRTCRRKLECYPRRFSLHLAYPSGDSVPRRMGRVDGGGRGVDAQQFKRCHEHFHGARQRWRPPRSHRSCDGGRHVHGKHADHIARCQAAHPPVHERGTKRCRHSQQGRLR